MATMHPNIVLVMTDQHCGDCLGLAGHPDLPAVLMDIIPTCCDIAGADMPNSSSSCTTTPTSNTTLYKQTHTLNCP